MKRKYGALIIILLFVVNFVSILFILEFSPVRGVGDVDRLEDGRYIVVESVSFSPLSLFTIGRIQSARVLMFDQYFNKIWEYEGPPERPLVFTHEAVYLQERNSILIVDTHTDRVLEVNITTKEIIWQWDAREVNWTWYNPDWKHIDYIQNPRANDWTHINHVNYIKERNSMIISVRNFDMLIEIAHNDTKNMIWYFGEFGNQSIMTHQHNPEVLPNGNILICDSRNNCIIEVNYTTKQIVWTWNDNGNLNWPRDADYISGGKYNGCYLITDTNNARIIIMDPQTGQKLRIITTHVLVPYEADYIPGEDAIIVGNTLNFQMAKFDMDGNVLLLIGISPIYTPFLIICIPLLCVFSYDIYKSIKKGKKLTSSSILERFLHIGFLIFFLVFYNFIVNAIFDLVILPIVDTILLPGV